MIESTVIVCILLLLAYLFDITFPKTKIPTVILLLALGWGVQQMVRYFNVPMPDLSSLLPAIGTIGLILIVLEGSLELELNRSKTTTIGKAFFMAMLPMAVLVFGGAVLLYFLYDIPFLIGLLNMIPFSIISSAISIPSAQNLCPQNKEFTIYEGSFSDTLGVLFFNMIIVQQITHTNIFVHVSVMVIGMLVAGLFATLLLSYLLGKIKHSVKFMPIILMALLIFAVAEHFHMPGLIFIMLFGIFLENSKKLSHIKFIQKIHPENMEQEVEKFKDLTSEAAFLVRSIFFILFGYLLKTSDLLNTDSLLLAIVITAAIYLIRLIHLKIFKIDAFPLLFIAPRGLITIVLYLSISDSDSIPFINQPLVVQVILLTAIIMMIELLLTKSKCDCEQELKEKEKNAE